MRNGSLLLLISALAVNGCAYMYSATTRSIDANTGIVTERTSARAYAFLDSNAALTKFANRSGYGTSTNMYAPGTYVSGLNESATSSNLSSIISAVAQGVVSGLKP